MPSLTARLRARNEWTLASVLPRADRPLAIAWFSLLGVRGLLPALFSIAMGFLVGAVQRHDPLGTPLALVGAMFVLLQVLPPVHQAVGQNLGSRLAAWLYDRLAWACVRPPGMGHLENPRLTSDLSMARDFDLAITGPPLFIAMDFVAAGAVEMVGGYAAALVLFAYAWWAPPVLAGAWFATHRLLRESAVWFDRRTEEVRAAQRDADYAYRLATGPASAKELRLFGLGGWVVDRFRARRRQLFQLQWEATRLRERPLLWSLLIVLAANVLVFGSMAMAAADGRLPLGRLVVFASAALSTSLIAFGGLSWALDGVAAPVGAVLRLEGAMAAEGALGEGRGAAVGLPAREIRFRDVTFRYPTAGDSAEPVLAGFDLTIPAGSSLAIVGQNGAGKTTLAKLLCRLYDPQAGAIEIDGTDLRALDLDGWRARVTAVFQDFIRFELPLRDNVAPAGASDEAVLAALADAGASGLAGLDTILARGYPGGTDLSGGQWQRIALARALCAVRLGAGVVLLDEPTAQLDVRGEAEIFDRILAATRHTTTILISHRFSTVRHADRICVLEHGRVIELGSHDELMALGGRYHTMFELQASRFDEVGENPEATFDVLD
jgi:ABC-type multidrug transport system fused ATPase/permease subunit